MVFPEKKLPYIETPLVPSIYLSEHAGVNVYLKLELIQPSGSFKSRGLGNLVYKTVMKDPSKKYHFFSPSGGNAGCATAFAAALYGQACTVCVPSSTNKLMIERIRKVGANVIMYGDYIAQSDTYIQKVLIPQAKLQNPDVETVYCHPYNDQTVWEGNSTLATELVEQLGKDNKPDAVICSVGGGGLYNGIVEGFQHHGWNDVPILAVETEGVASLNMSLKSGGHQVNLDKPNSIATSLSTINVTKRTIEYAMGLHPTKSIVVSDAEAAEACIRFANDHKLLIEAACGTALAPIYTKQIHSALPNLDHQSKVVVIICGGSSVSWDILKGYSERFGIQL